jgi:hypothetical protein
MKLYKIDPRTESFPPVEQPMSRTLALVLSKPWLKSKKIPFLLALLNSFVDIQITDRQNIDNKITDRQNIDVKIVEK